MSYVEYARTASEWLWATAELVHHHAFPFCGNLVLQGGKQWPPLQKVLDIAGPTIPTYVLELLVVFVVLRIFVYVVHIVSNTLYRLFKLVFSLTAVIMFLFVLFYFYLTMTENGQTQLKKGGGSFWVDQALSFANHLAPAWNGPANNGNDLKFKFQQPGRAGH